MSLSVIGGIISGLAGPLGQVAERYFDNTYGASAELAAEKGPFPLYREEYLKSNFVRTLPASVKKEIRKHGIRNSHLNLVVCWVCLDRQKSGWCGYSNVKTLARFLN